MEDTDGGYGLKIAKGDRDKCFPRKIEKITLKLQDKEEFEVILTDSFWRSCAEFRDRNGRKDIQTWLAEQMGLPWPYGKPPKYEAKINGNYVRVLKRVG